MSTTPTVLWWQNPKTVILKVQVPNASDVQIKFEPLSVKFNCTASSPQSQVPDKSFEVALELFKSVSPQACTWKKKSSHIEVTLKKEEEAKNKEDKWVRLVKSSDKNHKIKVDWDSYVDDEDDEDEKKSRAPPGFPDGLPPNMMPPGMMPPGMMPPGSNEPPVDYDELFKNIPKKSDDALAEGKWIYLLAFNVLSFFLWGAILFRLVVHASYVFGGSAELSDTYSQIGYIVLAAQALGLLEIINSLVGLVKARPLPAFLLHAGRNILLFGVVWQFPSVQKDWGVFGLFLIWSIGDIIRFIFYFVETIAAQGLTSIMERFTFYRIMRSLRYSAPLILLPLGFFVELRLFYYAFFYVDLPTWAYSALPGYVPAAYLAGAPFLYYSMYKQRQSKLKLGSTPSKQKKKKT